VDKKEPLENDTRVLGRLQHNLGERQYCFKLFESSANWLFSQAKKTFRPI
jgi:hypothetical protein